MIDAADIDGDGDLDFYYPLYHGSVSGRLLRNDGGWGNFVDVTSQYELHSAIGGDIGAGFGDYNGDGVPARRDSAPFSIERPALRKS